MLKAIYALLVSLPELLKLVKQMQAKQKQQAAAKLVKEDIKKINKAFEDGDAEALRNIFNS